MSTSSLVAKARVPMDAALVTVFIAYCVPPPIPTPSETMVTFNESLASSVIFVPLPSTSLAITGAALVFAIVKLPSSVTTRGAALVVTTSKFPSSVTTNGAAEVELTLTVPVTVAEPSMVIDPPASDMGKGLVIEVSTALPSAPIEIFTRW